MPLSTTITHQKQDLIMKNLLFPHKFQPIGWCAFIPALTIGILTYFDIFASLPNWAYTMVNDIAIIGIAVGALFIVCSRERIEDEMTRAIRLSSLLNSIYVYVVLLIVCTLFINGLEYFYFLIANTVLLPIIFVINFRLEMARYNKMSDNEEQN